jgi:hypothetical protein
MTEAEKRAWLDGLQIGDQVAFWPGGVGRTPSVRVVASREKRGRGTIVVASDRVGGSATRFDAQSGYERDSSSYRAHIAPVDDRVRAIVTFTRDANRLATVNLAMQRMGRDQIRVYDADAVSAAIAELERLLGVP